MTPAAFDMAGLVRGSSRELPQSGWLKHPVGPENAIAALERLRRSDLRQCRAVIRSLLYLLLRRALGLFRSDERMAAEAELEIAVLRH